MPDETDLIRAMGSNRELKKMAVDFLRETAPYRYTYHFTWLGLPIIQLPQDIVAVQDIVWRVKPDLIIETGVAHGGSLILSASLLELIGGEGEVLGIDIDIHPHNRAAIEGHPLARRVRLIEGSSTDPEVAARAAGMARGKKSVLVMLDSDHTHDHVLRELHLYSPLVTVGSYLVVFDTSIDDMPAGLYPGRPWGRGNNPRTAVREFLATNDQFVVDQEIEDKILVTVASGGYLTRVKD
ncbi:MAG TPA: cephalosporin hydroxylase family protein [Phycisphaerae bacterium]|nr:cephalosporin hydroxylase family protein [Phycisphaerae bacterium]